MCVSGNRRQLPMEFSDRPTASLSFRSDRVGRIVFVAIRHQSAVSVFFFLKGRRRSFSVSRLNCDESWPPGRFVCPPIILSSPVPFENQIWILRFQTSPGLSCRFVSLGWAFCPIWFIRLFRFFTPLMIHVLFFHSSGLQ